jgi:hypothetical protein
MDGSVVVDGVLCCDEERAAEVFWRALAPFSPEGRRR